MELIELVDVEKVFGDSSILKGINLSIKQGEFVTLLGPSGSGKTTLIRLLAGFEWLTRGEIKVNGRDIKDLEPYDRDLSTIFQDYALFPHLNVEGNIKFGLKLVRKPLEGASDAIKERLLRLQDKWAKKADLKIKKISLKQELLNKKLSGIKSGRFFNRLQAEIDDLDFKYSFWENYLEIKTERYTKRHLTRKLTKEEINESFDRIVKIVGLSGNTHKRIDEISGGMKQRVALARSLIIEPEILLLDEPLSALDAKLRGSMRIFLKDVQRSLGKTFILVTHDQEEALELSDRIAVINDGVVQQFDTPRAIYDYPKNRWVASFIGDSNIFRGKIVSPGEVIIFGKRVKYDLSDPAYKDFYVNQVVDCLIRPEDVDITTAKKGFPGEVISVNYKGSYYYLRVRVNKEIIEVETSNLFKVNQLVYISFEIDAIHLMLPEDLEEDKEG